MKNQTFDCSKKIAANTKIVRIHIGFCVNVFLIGKKLSSSFRDYEENPMQPFIYQTLMPPYHIEGDSRRLTDKPV